MTTLKLSSESPLEISSDAIAILLKKDFVLTASGQKLDTWTRKALSKQLRAEGFQVKSKNIALFYSGRKNAPRVFVTALPGQTSIEFELREAAYAVTRAASRRGVKRLTIAFDPADDAQTVAIGEGALLATYEYAGFKTQKNGQTRITSITVCSSEKNSKAARTATIFCDASFLVRDLVNEPPNTLNALKLAQTAQDIARKHGLKITIYGPDKLTKMGALAFLSVGKGSPVPGQMIHLTYEPEESPRAHVALVGKGITFDSGGLSLKSEKGMEHMKSDMSGAATVLACLRAAKELKLPVKVTGLMMAIENMPNSGANRPGDVIRSMNGKTIEITNTDAEGRLALADGLTFTQTLSPDFIIDIATLTGAQVVSLGRLIGAVMGNDRDFVNLIVEAGEKSGELFWPLPLYEPYREMIKSDIADIRNSSGIAEAPSIQAGLFLSEFVTSPRWVHLDIA
ncbi:MAG: aminopeptidase, partial [Acidobacteria bacterium]